MSAEPAPTVNVNVSPVSRLETVELGLAGDVSDLLAELLDLSGDGLLVLVDQHAAVVLDLQVTDALQHRVDLVEGTLSGLHERDGILRVALGLGETTDLSAHLLGDGEAGGVVGGTVDAVARRQLLHGLGGLGRGAGQLTVGVERLNVVLDTKAHDHLSLMIGCLSRGNSMSPLPTYEVIGAVARTFNQNGRPWRPPVRAIAMQDA